MIGADDESWVKRRFTESAGGSGDPTAVVARLIGERCPLLDDASLSAETHRLVATLVGLGPLDALLNDPAVTDVLVNGAGPVWVERAGRLQRTDVVVSDSDIATLVECAFRRNGLSVDRARPIADTRLENGARLSVVLAPLAVDGTLVAIRRFPDRAVPLAGFAEEDVLAPVRRRLRGRANIVVFGATGTGKTTLVNALAAEIDPGERVVTIEDAAELRLDLPHVVRLECRPHNGDGAGRVDLRTLVRAALRLRPDRLVVGEVRGPEALDMIWALATGHDGSLSTCHARSPAEVLARLETFVMLADADLPLAAVRAQVRAAVDVVIGVGRSAAGRRIVSVHDVVADPRHPTGVVQVVPT